MRALDHPLRVSRQIRAARARRCGDGCWGSAVCIPFLRLHTGIFPCPGRPPGRRTAGQGGGTRPPAPGLPRAAPGCAPKTRRLRGTGGVPDGGRAWGRAPRPRDGAMAVRGVRVRRGDRRAGRGGDAGLTGAPGRGLRDGGSAGVGPDGNVPEDGDPDARHVRHRRHTHALARVRACRGRDTPGRSAGGTTGSPLSPPRHRPTAAACRADSLCPAR
jgi:hypothetical protein